jgi:hypothetical protein
MLDDIDQRVSVFSAALMHLKGARYGDTSRSDAGWDLRACSGRSGFRPGRAGLLIGRHAFHVCL